MKNSDMGDLKIHHVLWRQFITKPIDLCWATPRFLANIPMSWHILGHVAWEKSMKNIKLSSRRDGYLWREFLDGPLNVLDPRHLFHGMMVPPITSRVSYLVFDLLWEKIDEK